MGHVVVQRDIKCVRTAKVLNLTVGKRAIFIVPLFYRGSGGKGPSRERTCYPRTKFSPVSVHSSLVVLHFAEKETGDHFSCFPI